MTAVKLRNLGVGDRFDRVDRLAVHVVDFYRPLTSNGLEQIDLVLLLLAQLVAVLPNISVPTYLRTISLPTEFTTRDTTGDILTNSELSLLDFVMRQNLALVDLDQLDQLRPQLLV